MLFSINISFLPVIFIRINAREIGFTREIVASFGEWITSSVSSLVWASAGEQLTLLVITGFAGNKTVVYDLNSSICKVWVFNDELYGGGSEQLFVHFTVSTTI